MKQNTRGGGGRFFGSPKLKACALFAVLAMLTLGVVVATDGSEESSADITPTYTYDTITKTATVSGGSGSGALVIPTTVTNPDDPVPTTLYRVTSIAMIAFAYNVDITSADLGSVETIGTSAFSGCTNLTTVNLGSVTSLPAGAFNYCTSLTSIDLSSVETIGRNAFNSCISLISVDLSSTKTITEQAFQSCTSLTSVYLGNITSIENALFRYCASLTSLNIPTSVASIGLNAFNGCTSLKILAVPSQLAVANLTTAGYSGNYVSYSGVNSVTAHSADGISVTIETSTFRTLTSLTNSSGENLSFTGRGDSWSFTFPSSGTVRAVFGALDFNIRNVDDLRGIGTDSFWTMTSSYTLVNNISFTATDEPFSPIGSANDPFTGSFDGNGHTISNINIDTSQIGRAAGLFGYLSGSAQVFDLTMTGGGVMAGDRPAGGIAGVTLEGSVAITNCHNSNAIVSAHMAGGIVGYVGAGTTIGNCTNSAAISVTSITGSAYAGGIAGFVTGVSNYVVMISNSSNSGAVSAYATDSRAGGIAGFARHMAATACDNSGAVRGGISFEEGSTVYVAGIAGRLESSSLVRCTNSSTGTVGITSGANPGTNGSIRYWLGGVAGDMTQGSSIDRCYNEAIVGASMPVGTSRLYVGGLVGCMYQGTSAIDSTNFVSVTGGNESIAGLYVYAGGVTGAATGTSSLSVTITNCDVVGTAVTMTVTAANARVGGIVGYGNYAAITGCDSIATVVGAGGSTTYNVNSASVRSGGIAGYLENSTASACTSSGRVSATTLGNDGLPRAGGIVGSMVMGTTLTRCAAHGDIIASAGARSSGKAYAGGVAGLTEGTISGCTYGSAVTQSRSVTSVGFASGAGGIAGMVGTGSVVGVAHANVVAEYTESVGSGRAGTGAAYVMQSASVDSKGSSGTRTVTPVPQV